MKKLSDLINSSMPANFQSYMKVKKVWNDSAGDTIAFLTTVTSFKDGLLNVAVHDQVWMSEIGFLKGDLIHRLNSAGLTVSNINFFYKQRKNQVQSKPVTRKTMTDKEKKFADRLVSSIPDEQLRDAFRNAIYSYFTVYTLDDYLNC